VEQRKVTKSLFSRGRKDGPQMTFLVVPQRAWLVARTKLLTKPPVDPRQEENVGDEGRNYHRRPLSNIIQFLQTGALESPSSRVA
jgi:hypothetical protein